MPKLTKTRRTFLMIPDNDGALNACVEGIAKPRRMRKAEAARRLLFGVAQRSGVIREILGVELTKRS